MTRTPRTPPERTRLGLALGITALVLGATCAPFTLASLHRLATGYDVLPAVSPWRGLAVSGIASLALLAGGVGLLLARAWGWWSAAAGALLAVLDSARFFAPLVARVNWGHPRAAELALDLAAALAFPGALALAYLVALCLPSVRRERRA